MNLVSSTIFIDDDLELVKKLESLVSLRGWNIAVLRSVSSDMVGDKDYLEARFLTLRNVVVAYISYVDDLLTKNLDSDPDFPLLRLSDSVEYVIQQRLTLFGQDMVKRLFEFFIEPNNLDFAISSLCKTSDFIWCLVGDKSDDFSYYSKRMVLSLLYSTMILKFVCDESDNHMETFMFLQKRIEGIVRFSKFKQRVKMRAQEVSTRFPLVNFLLFA